MMKYWWLIYSLLNLSLDFLVVTRPPGSCLEMKLIILAKTSLVNKASTVWKVSSNSLLVKQAWIALWQSQQIVSVVLPPLERGTIWWSDGLWLGRSQIGHANGGALSISLMVGFSFISWSPKKDSNLRLSHAIARSDVSFSYLWTILLTRINQIV